MNHALHIHGLSISYDGHLVVSDLSLQVAHGEVVCLAGESGCGKSSVLRSVLGFVDFDGSIEVEGMKVDACTIDNVRKRVAYVPQELALPHERVEEMVRMPFALKANSKISFSLETLLEEWQMLDLSRDLLDKRVNEISGGQRQRIMLSVAGLLGKSLLLADEPTSALDRDSALMVARYFRMLASDRGMAVLAVSHSPVFAELCDRVIRLTPEPQKDANR